MAEKKPLYKRTWFVVVVILLVLSGVGNAIGGSEPEETETTRQTAAPSETPAEVAAIEESPSASPEATDSPLSDPDSEESIAYFAYSSTGQFKDMDKDLDDAVKRANNDQTIRLMGNMLELTFNFGQLEALDAPTSVAKAWATGMGKLETSIDNASDIAGDYSTGQASLSEMLGSIEQVRAKVNALAKVVSSLK